MITKNKTINYVILLLTTYFCLIITDYALKKYWIYTSTYNKEVKPIIEHRNIENDNLRSEALIEGYEPVIQPNFWFDKNPELLEITKKFNLVPLTGKPYTKVYLCNEGYGLIKYTTDRFGLRNPDYIWDKEIDVMLVGDSFANGACVEEKFSISGGLRENYNAASLASNGNQPSQYNALIQVFSKYFLPKKAYVLILYVNDFEDDEKILNKENKFIKENYVQKNLDYFDIESIVNDKPEMLSKEIINLLDLASPIILKSARSQLNHETLKKNSYFFRGIKVLKKHYNLPEYRKLLPFNKTKKSTLSNNIKLTLKNIKKYCGLHSLSNKECKPIVIFIPNSKYWKPGFNTEYHREAISKFVSKSKVNMFFYDSTEDLKALGNKAYSPVGGHLSIEGYQIITKRIKLIIEKNE